MKTKTPFLLIAFFLVLGPGVLKAGDFLGAPLPPDAKTTLKTESRFEIVTPLSHDEVLEFYRKALEGQKDLKFRDWKDETYIEDDGKLRWHSITISKHYKDGTTVLITKDNWTWIIGTLILRFIGVFVVLLCLLLGLSLSGALISRSVQRMVAKKE